MRLLETMFPSGPLLERQPEQVVGPIAYFGFVTRLRVEDCHEMGRPGCVQCVTPALEIVRVIGLALIIGQ
jgi:hypothetical protein